MIKRLVFSFFLLSLACAAARAQAKPDSAATPTITAKTAGMEKLPGYVPLYWDAKAGKMWLEAGAGPACGRPSLALPEEPFVRAGPSPPRRAGAEPLGAICETISGLFQKRR